MTCLPTQSSITNNKYIHFSSKHLEMELLGQRVGVWVRVREPPRPVPRWLVPAHTAGGGVREFVAVWPHTLVLVFLILAMMVGA